VLKAVQWVVQRVSEVSLGHWIWGLVGASVMVVLGIIGRLPLAITVAIAVAVAFAVVVTVDIWQDRQRRLAREREAAILPPLRVVIEGEHYDPTTKFTSQRPPLPGTVTMCWFTFNIYIANTSTVHSVSLRLARADYAVHDRIS
jgi:hypothetical protein